MVVNIDKYRISSNILLVMTPIGLVKFLAQITY